MASGKETTTSTMAPEVGTRSPEKTENNDDSLNMSKEQSPTRVSEFEDSIEEDEDRDDEEASVLKEEGEDVHSPLASKPFVDDGGAGEPVGDFTPLFHQPRNLFLTTIEDNSSVSSSESSSVVRERKHKRLEEAKGDDDKPSKSVNNDERTAAVPAAQVPASNHSPNTSARAARAIDEVRRLKAAANEYASRGKEMEALKGYGRALKIMRSELSRTRRKLEYAGETPSLTPRLLQSWEDAASSISEIRTIMAILYERMGDYNKAIKYCHEAREVYSSYANLEQTCGRGTIDVAAHMEQMDVMLSGLATARDSFMDRKAMHEEVIHARHKMMRTKDKQGREKLYEEVVRILRRVLDRECESLGEGHPQVADTLGILARVYKEGNELDVAIDEQEAAVSILRTALGDRHPRSAIATRELGKMFEMRRKCDEDLEEAILLYTEAIAAFRHSYGDNHPMVGGTLNDLAVIHIRRREYDEASEKLSDALIAYESAMDSGGNINPDAAQVWKNFGECYSLRGDWESALSAYNSALNVQQDARRMHESRISNSPKPNKSVASAPKGIDDASLADTLCRLAKATAALERFKGAIDSYEEALQLYRGLLETATKKANGRNTSAMVGMQDRVAHTLYCLAEVREKNKNYDQAHALYSEALELRLNSDASRDEKSMNMVHCAMNLAGIGSVHMRKGEFTDACLVLKESLKFLEAHGVPENHEIYGVIKARLLVAEKGFLSSPSLNEEKAPADEDKEAPPPSIAMKGDKTLHFDQEAQQQMEAGDYDGAMRTLTTVIAIRRKRLTKRKKDAQDQCSQEKNDLARTLGNFATVLMMKGETKQAESLYGEAIRLYRSNGLKDEDPVLHDLLEELKRLQAVEL